MSVIVKANEAMTWESPPSADPLQQNHRFMTLMFERDITPTKNMAAGIVTLPPGQEQTRVSVHEHEEIYLVLEGKGEIILDEKAYSIEKDTAIYIAPGTGHRARNTGDQVMRLYYVNCPSVFGEVGDYKLLMKDWKRLR